MRPFDQRGYNPDVLTCIANLSNDEIFTPPSLVNSMLNELENSWAAKNDGEIIWQNPHIRFLDPFTKSGVFLREITARLTEGLTSSIPDLQNRVNHILTKQVFGLGITQLTSLLSRRSVYCSKKAMSKHSICNAFSTDDGNIWFKPTNHTWVGGKRTIRLHPTTGEEQVTYINRKCSFCGAGETDYGRGEDMESHAYSFIHTNDVKAFLGQIFGGIMHFDVVIGNPPYQLSDGGHGSSATPIYQKFVEQCFALDPNFVSLVIPARWYSGGKGLEEFRHEMLSKENLISLHDFPNTEDVFPGVNVRGGICYFLWGRDHSGNTEITTHSSTFPTSTSTRPLLEDGLSTFIRYNDGVKILKKVQAVESSDSAIQTGELYPSFARLVSSRKPFGLPTNYNGTTHPGKNSLKLYRNREVCYCPLQDVTDKFDLVNKVKLLVPYASPGTDAYPHLILSKPIVALPKEVATETYLAIGAFKDEDEARKAASYMGTKFFRFMVNLLRASQHVTKSVYALVPLIPLDRHWTDEELAKRYGLKQDEIEFIERYIKDVAWAGDYS